MSKNQKSVLKENKVETISKALETGIYVIKKDNSTDKCVTCHKRSTTYTCYIHVFATT